ncbi:MAG: TorF family putative porin [Janthinobacterium sp.]
MLLCAGTATAQVGGNIALLSDYRFRGVSMSDGQPVPQLTLNYDDPDSWYWGVQASGVNLHERGGTQWIAYAGMARRLASGWSWEAGASRSVLPRDHGSDYGEWYAGLAAERIGFRLYFSPHYFGRDTRTLYAEMNGFYPLPGGFKLVAHIDVLRPLPHAGMEAAGMRRDGSFGLAAALGDWNAQLAWVASSGGAPRSVHYVEAASRAVVLSAAYSF